MRVLVWDHVDALRILEEVLRGLQLAVEAGSISDRMQECRHTPGPALKTLATAPHPWPPNSRVNTYM